jgi:Flp pilus assembly pilin Flp
LLNGFCMPNLRAALATLARDTRGAVSVEYVTLTVVSFGIALAVAGLSVALMRAEQRAEAVLRSNSP